MKTEAVSLQTFKGVSQLKVIIDGRVSVDPANIKKATRSLVNILAGPINESANSRLITKKFASIDQDYSYMRAYRGNNKLGSGNNSDYIRCVNHKNAWFIVTGAAADTLKALGKQLGIARRMENENNIKHSFEVVSAKQNYGNYLKSYFGKYLSNKKQAPMLEVITNSSGTYGKKNFKVNVIDINWA